MNMVKILLRQAQRTYGFHCTSMGRHVMRYPILDGFRGFFLILMMSVHLNQLLQTRIGHLSPGLVSFGDGANGFVFMSGLVVSLVYGGKLVRGSPAAMYKAIAGRWLTIYAYHAGLVLILLATALLLGPAGGTLLRPYSEHPAAFTGASLLLLTCSHDMGILAMYLYFVAATPFFLILFHRGHILPAAAISLLVWAVGQTPFAGIAVDRAGAAIGRLGYNFNFDLGFNLMGWQLIYVLGLYAGYRLATRSVDFSILRGRQYELTFYICVAAFILFALLRQIIVLDLISARFSHRFNHELFHRHNVSVIHLISFLVDLYVLTWLAQAGPWARSAPIRRVAAAIRWLFTRRFLTFLGQHSLQVFAWHVMVLYAAILLTQGRPIGEISGTLLILCAVASLFIPAGLHAAYKKHQRGMAIPVGALDVPPPREQEWPRFRQSAA